MQISVGRLGRGRKVPVSSLQLQCAYTSLSTLFIKVPTDARWCYIRTAIRTRVIRVLYLQPLINACDRKAMAFVLRLGGPRTASIQAEIGVRTCPVGELARGLCSPPSALGSDEAYRA